MNDSSERLPHAALDPAGRLPKAEKIAALLALRPAPAGQRLRLLEVGTGAGVIAHYFSTRAGFDCDVDAVDVVDQRKVADGYRFRVVTSAELPFADATFDAVISNHVLEHVGGNTDQRMHLREIARVLKPGGVAYLATPNRWHLVEPHYRLAFLSWLPRKRRSAYLRWRGRGDCYDCEPLSMPELETMLRSSGMTYANICWEAIRAMSASETRRSLAVVLASRIPRVLAYPLRRFSPTHVYLLQRPV
ncbi:MAG: class I SAM-dependent methyltransferase [Xanthomonadales bacterium PRO7]|nr:class I SAM-dependent methyltransferase [Xanthomonadales bacterium PRO7]HMM57489.1 class I SAM-dependent methyltransferase [Rudaea sp.]